jgi:hypothetical protein
MIASPLIPALLELRNQLFGPPYVPGLIVLIPATQEDHDFLAAESVVDPVAGAAMNTDFADAIANAGDIAELPHRGDPSDTAKDLSTPVGISQALQPAPELSGFPHRLHLSLLADSRRFVN